MANDQKTEQLGLEERIAKKNAKIKLLKRVFVEVKKLQEKKERANNVTKLSNLDQKLKDI